MSLPRNYRYYRFAAIVLAPLLMLWLLNDLRRTRAWPLLRARFGFVPPHKTTVWIHCASVGEVNAITPLIKSLLDEGRKIHLSTFTSSGLTQAKRRLGLFDGIRFSLLAIDWRHTVRRQLKRLQPKEVWLVETEIWPTLMVEAKRSGCKIRLINGRLSHKTLRSPKKWRELLADLVNNFFDQRLVRSELDKQQFIELGMTTPAIVSGNLKRCDTWPTGSPRLHTRPYYLLASSHADEEIELARRWHQDKTLPDLVIVPRHPKRGAALATLFRQQGISIHRRSVDSSDCTSRFLLADTFGELPTWIAHAEGVVMGGSFVRRGGQNPLEAVYFGKIVLCGPDMSDFADETRDLSALGVLEQCADMDRLLNTIRSWLKNPKKARDVGKAGQAWLSQEKHVILAQLLADLRKPI